MSSSPERQNMWFFDTGVYGAVRWVYFKAFVFRLQGRNHRLVSVSEDSHQSLKVCKTGCGHHFSSPPNYIHFSVDLRLQRAKGFKQDTFCKPTIPDCPICPQGGASCPGAPHTNTHTHTHTHTPPTGCWRSFVCMCAGKNNIILILPNKFCV